MVQESRLRDAEHGMGRLALCDYLGVFEWLLLGYDDRYVASIGFGPLSGNLRCVCAKDLILTRYLSLGIRPDLGRHVGVEVTMAEVENFLKNLYAAALLYCLAIAFIKFTILAFYWKLFSIAARIPILILSVSVGCWLIILVRF